MSYSDLTKVPLADLLMHMFESVSTNEPEGEVLRRFVACMRDELDVLGHCESHPDNLDEILLRMGNRCAIVLELQRRLDEANTVEVAAND